MECPSCNTNNHGNRKSCSNCGLTLENLVPAIHCPTCDGLARVSEDKVVEAPYCKNCGFSLREFVKNSKTFEPKMVRIDQLAQEKPKVVEETLPDVDSATSVVPTPSASVTQVKATQETNWLESILETIANSPRIKWMIVAGVIIVILAIVSGRENSERENARIQNLELQILELNTAVKTQDTQLQESENLRQYQREQDQLNQRAAAERRRQEEQSRQDQLEIQRREEVSMEKYRQGQLEMQRREEVSMEKYRQEQQRFLETQKPR